METTTHTTGAVITLNPSIDLMVDQLGFLQNEADALKEQIESLKATIKAQGAGSYLGARYVSKVIQPTDSEKIDWETIALHFNPSRQLITAHTKIVSNAARITTTLQKGKA